MLFAESTMVSIQTRNDETVFVQGLKHTRKSEERPPAEITTCVGTATDLPTQDGVRKKKKPMNVSQHVTFNI